MKQGNKSYVLIAVGVALVAVLLYAVVGFSKAETPEELHFTTDKTDRTLIKEIWQDQKEVLRLLGEIKGALEQSE